MARSGRSLGRIYLVHGVIHEDSADGWAASRSSPLSSRAGNKAGKDCLTMQLGSAAWTIEFPYHRMRQLRSPK